MSNVPVPDYRVIWSNGTKLTFNLRQNFLSISVPPRRSPADSNSDTNSSSESSADFVCYEWDTSGGATGGGDSWSSGAPHRVQQYLRTGQRTMGICLEEERQIDTNTTAATSNLRHRNVLDKLSAPMSLPHVIFKNVSEIS